MGSFSMVHWFIVAIIVLLLFGNRLPSVMRSLGRGVVEFKKGLAGIEDDLNESVNKNIEDSASRKRDETSPQKQEEPVAKEATQSKSV